MKFANFLRTYNLNNTCERPTAFLVWKMAHEFTITLSFSSSLSNSEEILKPLLFMFHSLKLIASKFRQWAWFWTHFIKDSLYFIYFDVITRQRQKKKFKLVEVFSQSREWSKNMWYCAVTQRSYLTVAQLTFAECRSTLKVH